MPSFTPETLAAIEEWNKRKMAQWQRALDSGTPGLQLVRHETKLCHFMLVCSTDDFYEGVVIGQLPKVQREVVDTKDGPVVKFVPEGKKMISRRSIDLSDEQIDVILARWRAHESALGLTFVLSVFDNKGLEHHAIPQR